MAQWVKRWPADLAVPSSSLAQGEIYSNVNRVPLHTTFHYHPDRPDMTDVLLKRMFNRESSNNPSKIPFINSLTLLSTETKIAEFANSVDLDEAANNEPSYQDLHYLPSCL